MDNSDHICADPGCLDDRVRHLPSEDSIYSMCRIFNALQCTTRLKILFLLLQGDLCVKAIEDALGITQSAISHSLKKPEATRSCKGQERRPVCCLLSCG